MTIRVSGLSSSSVPATPGAVAVYDGASGVLVQQAGDALIAGDLALASGGGDTFQSFDDGATAAVSAANTGRLRYNDTSTQFEASVNGGAWAALGGGGVATVDILQIQSFS